jgi:hypothetical protein
MPRAMVFLMTLMFVLPSDGSAQAAPSPGDRIRIRQVDGPVLTGTFATASAETIQLSLDSEGPTVEVPVEGIEALEISLGRQRRFGKYIGLTVAATSLVGATIGLMAYDDRPCSFLCFGPNTRGEYMGLGFAYGVLIGLPLGALIGSVVREERWSPVSLPAPAASRLSIRPVIGSQVGFAGSIRVGGL